MLIFVHHDVESSSSTYYHLYTPHPRSPIAAINAIGFITDSVVYWGHWWPGAIQVIGRNFLAWIRRDLRLSHLLSIYPP